MRRNYQGGSLLGFIIVAVLLGLLLIGGLYGLNRYNAQKAADEAVASKEQAKEEEATEPSQTKTDDAASNEESTTTDPGGQTRTQDAPAANPAANSSTAGTSGRELPQTGPADSLYVLFVAAALVFAGTHFVRSRHSA
jgi:cytoskeletal protein RodZ